jgi:hypothetical protein
MDQHPYHEKKDEMLLDSSQQGKLSLKEAFIEVLT